MYPSPIEHYFAPLSITAALEALADDPDAVLLAGGQSLVPQMKARERSPATLIDINRIAGIDGIIPAAGGLSLGALARYREVLHVLRGNARFAALADAISVIGDRQVRNRGTLVGNLAHGDHTGDIAPCALVFGGMLCAARRDGGEDTIDLTNAPIRPRAGGSEIKRLFTRIALRSCAMGSAFIKMNRVAQDRAIINVAVAFDLSDDGRCANPRVAVGGILPGATRVPDCEAALDGEILRDRSLTEAADIAADRIATQDDGMAGAAYRTQLIRSGVRTALATSLQRARAAQA